MSKSLSNDDEKFLDNKTLNYNKDAILIRPSHSTLSQECPQEIHPDSSSKSVKNLEFDSKIDSNEIDGHKNVALPNTLTMQYSGKIETTDDNSSGNIGICADNGTTGFNGDVTTSGTNGITETIGNTRFYGSTGNIRTDLGMGTYKDESPNILQTSEPSKVRRGSLILPRLKTTGMKSIGQGTLQSPTPSTFGEQIHALQLISSNYYSKLLLAKHLNKYGQNNTDLQHVNSMTPCLNSSDEESFTSSPVHEETQKRTGSYFQLHSPRTPISNKFRDFNDLSPRVKTKEKQRSPLAMLIESGGISQEELTLWVEKFLKKMKQKQLREAFLFATDFVNKTNVFNIREQIQSCSLWADFWKKWNKLWDKQVLPVPVSRKEMKKLSTQLQEKPLDDIFVNIIENRFILFGIAYLFVDFAVSMRKFISSRKKDLALIIKLLKDSDTSRIDGFNLICKLSLAMIETDLFCLHRISPTWRAENIIKLVYIPLLKEYLHEIIDNRDFMDFVDALDLFQRFKHDTILLIQNYIDIRQSIPREVFEEKSPKEVSRFPKEKEGLWKSYHVLNSKISYRDISEHETTSLDDIFDPIQILFIHEARELNESLKDYILLLGSRCNADLRKYFTSEVLPTSAVGHHTDLIHIPDSCKELIEELSYLFQMFCRPIYSELSSTLIEVSKSVLQSFAWIIRDNMQKVLSSKWPTSIEIQGLYYGCNALTFLINQCHIFQRFLATQVQENIDSFNAIAYKFSTLLKRFLLQIVQKHLSEISKYIIVDVEASDWQTFRAFQGETRCNYGIEMWYYYIRGVLYDLEWECRVSRALSTEIVGQIIVQSLKTYLLTYENIFPSRIRSKQFMCDISYIIYFARTFRLATSASFMHLINKYCIYLAAVGATLCCPLSYVTSFLMQTEEEQKQNQVRVLHILEYEQDALSKTIPPNIWHPNPIFSYHQDNIQRYTFLDVIDYYTSTDAIREFHSNMWNVSYDWTLLLDVCTTLGMTNISPTYLSRLEKRHEFMVGEYPELTESEKKEASQTLNLIHSIKERVEYKQ